MARVTPSVEGENLVLHESTGTLIIRLGTPAWEAWLMKARTFNFSSSTGSFTARNEAAGNRRGGRYWKAYRKSGGRLYRAYLGKDQELTSARLSAVAALLAERCRDESSSLDASGDVLLTTKFAIPQPGRDVIVRRPLLERVEAGSRRRLLLVTAPAGFGKTTLLSIWAGRTAGPALWLALDPTDNEPARFCRYLILALVTRFPEPLAEVVALLEATPAPLSVKGLTMLLNALARVAGDVVLVLDDCHVLTSNVILDGLDFLIEHLPGNWHIVMAGRNEPPLPFARWRAQGHLAELRIDDLRFGLDETSRFLMDVTGAELAVADLALLHERTEGWAAALRLAGLALAGQPNVTRFIASFGGDHPYLLHYLANDVFESLSGTMQAFLLETSLLDRLSVPLCAAVTGMPDSRAMLQHIERLQLFLTPLDPGRQWYRYHQLFAEFLRARLYELRPERVSDVHRAAAMWLAHNELPQAAMAHALAGHDWGHALALLEVLAPMLLRRHEVATLLEWFIVLPEAALRARPRLSLYYAAALVYMGQLDAVELHLNEGIAALRVASPALDRRQVLGEVAALRGAVAALRNDAAQAVAQSHHALDLLPDDDRLVRGLAGLSIGFASIAAGDVARAVQALAEAGPLNQTAGNSYLALVARCSLAYVRQAQGRLQDAATMYRQVLEDASTWGGALVPVAGWANIGLGVILHEWNDLDAAVEELRRGIERCRQWQKSELIVAGLLALALAHISQGNVPNAGTTVAEALQLASQSASQRVQALAACVQVHVALASGDLAAAGSWVRAVDLRHDWYGFEHGFEHLTVVKVLLAQGRAANELGLLHEGLRLLHDVRRAVEVSGWSGRLVRIGILEALLYQELDDTARAQDVLDHVLELGEAAGFMRSFLDAGRPMEALLRKIDARHIASGYVQRLLWAFTGREATSIPGNREPASGAAMRGQSPRGEALTERELDVLRLVAAGHSNQEIADQRVLAVGTVKWYLKEIYRKLGVHSRTAAIARARVLELLG